MKVSQLASRFSLPVELLTQTLDMEKDELVPEGTILEVPSRGYSLRNSWFFMDSEIYDSFLIRGFLREDLPADKFEKVYSTAWGKVYKLNK